MYPYGSLELLTFQDSVVGRSNELTKREALSGQGSAVVPRFPPY